jgi:hypothetical protein
MASEHTLKSVTLDHFLQRVVDKLHVLGHADAEVCKAAPTHGGGLHVRVQNLDFHVYLSGRSQPVVKVQYEVASRKQDADKAALDAATVIHQYLEQAAANQRIEERNRVALPPLRELAQHIQKEVGGVIALDVEARFPDQDPYLFLNESLSLSSGKLRLPRDPELALTAARAILKAKEEVRARWNQALSLVQSLHTGPDETVEKP